ncbi:hypothetical protein [Kineosporia sp. NBRC 101731]|uniref:hypothetical protein n=1 Tax=Kineosporia sp. NBRC 101731 TaxID=3032199 RepID=UPI0025557091|nr:hypothetical protein [Kineosporia sp. NBRC 101731]
MAQHDNTGPRQRGRHLARRLRGSANESTALQWKPSAVVEAHTGSIAIDDPSTRLGKLRAIRDHMAAPDQA